MIWQENEQKLGSATLTNQGNENYLKRLHHQDPFACRGRHIHGDLTEIRNCDERSVKENAPKCLREIPAGKPEGTAEANLTKINSSILQISDASKSNMSAEALDIW